ncbi:hypothetical protein D3C71_2038210 [compost metagenome]
MEAFIAKTFGDNSKCLGVIDGLQAGPGFEENASGFLQTCVTFKIYRENGKDHRKLRSLAVSAARE